MHSNNLAHVTQELINSYGNTAKNVIQAYRVGNARATNFVEQRWVDAVNRMGNKLSEDVRVNALAAQQKVSGYFNKGIQLGIDGSDVVINKAVALAGKGIEQFATNAHFFHKATGLTSLNSLASVAIPTVVAVSGVAAKIEATSDKLVHTMAGTKPQGNRTGAKHSVAKRSAAKPAATKRATTRKIAEQAAE